MWRILVLLALALSSPACEPIAEPARRAPPPVEAASRPAAEPPSLWRPLASDGIHDPDNPALLLLQQPEEALSVLPPAQEGNHVDWVEALRSGAIQPRTNIYPETKIRVLDENVLMEDTAGMPMVLFPHRPHTEWLDCSNCHDRIFKAKKGANPVTMFAILQGEFCGQCHGAVSFPLTQCQRCHSVPRPAPPASGAAVTGAGG